MDSKSTLHLRSRLGVKLKLSTCRAFKDLDAPRLVDQRNRYHGTEGTWHLSQCGGAPPFGGWSNIDAPGAGDGHRRRTDRHNNLLRLKTFRNRGCRRPCTWTETAAQPCSCFLGFPPAALPPSPSWRPCPSTQAPSTPLQRPCDRLPRWQNHHAVSRVLGAPTRCPAAMSCVTPTGRRSRTSTPRQRGRSATGEGAHEGRGATDRCMRWAGVSHRTMPVRTCGSTWRRREH
jgi:hypothetical protein